jgi:eukaryotic-like serine/threonine-protein kinase
MVSPVPQELRPGARLGPYEIVSLLGAGGMGEVWRARDPRLDREVALKVLPAELAEVPGRLARFQREARALAALSHPNIVTIHSVEEAEGVRFITMERVEGDTLSSLISRGGMALDQFFAIAIPLADALAAAHARGVVHRDLKPANVMVTEKGWVKILDFGLAKPASGAAGNNSRAPTDILEPLTREGVVLGTVPYMSPEQLQGRPADARSDIFSLGTVLCEMATGQRPFRGTSPGEVLSSILSDEPPSVSDLRPDLPRQLGRIVRHCLAKDPDRRFQSATDLRNELEELREELAQNSMIEKIEGPRRRQEASVGDAVEPAISASMRRRRLAIPALLAIPLILVALLLLRRGDESPQPVEPTALAETAFPRTALAVLPFVDLSADPEYAYFASGLHDELLTQLSRVAALSPRGRTSVMGYAGTTKPLRQIAEELEVGALVEGSVQVVAGRLRVGVRLLDPATGEPLWAERYDRPLDDAFAIQSEVAQRVVAAVGATLASDERRAIAEAPTANAEAYLLYLQGLEYYRRPGARRSNVEIAQQLFERALELDPEFALAHVALSEVHGLMYSLRYDPSLSRVAAQREAAEAALRIAPDLPQAHLAMAMTYTFGQPLGKVDWEARLRHLEVALGRLPHDVSIVTRIAAVNRILGNWDAALDAFERAAELDPRDATVFGGLGYALRELRRYPEAVAAFDRAVLLTPDVPMAILDRAWTSVLWKGDLAGFRTVLDGLPEETDIGSWFGTAAGMRAWLLLWEREADALLDHVEGINPEILESQTFYWPRPLYTAWAHQLRDDAPAARRAFDHARLLLESVPPDREIDYRIHGARGLALAGLGRREEAVAEARRLEESFIHEGWLGMIPRLLRAWILAQSEEAEAALDEIERLLAEPSFLTVHWLRLDPRWDPIRDHPRFQALLDEYAH